MYLVSQYRALIWLLKLGSKYSENMDFFEKFDVKQITLTLFCLVIAFKLLNRKQHFPTCYFPKETGFYNLLSAKIFVITTIQRQKRKLFVGGKITENFLVKGFLPIQYCQAFGDHRL